MNLITIVTPTYNRCKELEILYKSLCEQESYNFLWLIIDDGSLDETRNIVNNFNQEKFKIEYIYKENGGKHTALNVAFRNVSTELIIIVDSDDFLTKDATKQIEVDWNKYKNNKSICGLVYAKKDLNNNFICDHFKDKEFEENYISYIINQNIKGDKAEVFRSDIIKNYSFPIFKNEKFIGEGIIWCQIARKYNMIFFDKAIYVCDYLPNGLTKSGRKMRIHNPKGGMYHASEFLDNIYKFKIREKNALLYLTYAMFSKQKIIKLILENKYRLLLIMNLCPSFILYRFWKNKYK